MPVCYESGIALRSGGKLGKSTIWESPRIRTKLRWWLAVVLAVLAYVCLKWIIPSYAGSSAVMQRLASTGQSSAVFVSLLFVGFAGFSLFDAYRRRRAHDLDMGLATLRALPQERFGHFVRSAFENEGYAVANAKSGRGADLVLVRGDERLVVQYRRWRSESIDAEPLRELHDCMGAEAATGCVFLTAGQYAIDARRFAAGKPLRLISGHELERMLRGLEGACRSGGARADESPRP